MLALILCCPNSHRKNNRTNIMYTHTRDNRRGRDSAKLASTSPCTVIIHATLNTCHLRLSVFSSDYPPLGHLKRPKSALIAAPIFFFFFSQTSLSLSLTSAVSVCACVCAVAVHKSWVLTVYIIALTGPCLYEG